MALAFELAFALGLALVAVSFGLLALGRAQERFLLAAAVVLGVGALAATVALAVNIVEPSTDNDAILLAAGGLAAAAVAELGLLGLARGLKRVDEVEKLAESA